MTLDKKEELGQGNMEIPVVRSGDQRGWLILVCTWRCLGQSLQ
jgi:hypothetical protein